MRKIGVFIFVLLTIFPLVIAQETEANNAVACIEKIVQDKTCDILSLEEKTFSLLALQKCESELLSSSNNYECWPKSSCSIKQTAQSIFALDSVGTSTNPAKTWLLSKTKIPSDMQWYLQIDSNEPTSCTISYSGNSYSVTINEDKTINTHAGDCLRLAQDDYWLRIPSNCYNQEFEISCDNSFKTSTIFKKTSSPIFYISEETTSGSSGSKVTKKINSKCFSLSETCDYEGTLWATLALQKLGEGTSDYVPYLITSADSNSKYLPESFLTMLAGDSYYDELLAKQISKQYWDASGDKFYDTALAFLALQSKTSEEKTSSINWILDNQESDGCWDNFRNTAFIIYSLWPIKASTDTCDSSGGYCMPEVDCEGNVLSATCSGIQVCCSKPAQLETCSVMGGKICSSDEICSGTKVTASNTNDCCTGSCKSTSSTTEKSECELKGGTCSSFCGSSEEEKNYECLVFGDVCCFSKSSSNYWYLWVLGILIILTLIAIFFRDKLKFYWIRFISKFGKSSKPPSEFPTSPSEPRRIGGIPRRRIIPGSSSRPPSKPIPQKPRTELDEVLKKLKDIGK